MISEFDWYYRNATDAQKSAWFVLNKMGWPAQLTSKDFAGMPGTTGIGRWIQKAGYVRKINGDRPDGAWVDGGGKPFNVYEKQAQPT